MTREGVRRSAFWLVILFLVACIGIHDYNIDKQKNNFNISDVSWHADAKSWTDNTVNNVYDVKFQLLDGTDTRQISSKKPNYTMEIDSSAEKGELNIKVYNNKKILFEKSGNINKTIQISDSDSKNVKVELTGKGAKGHTKITLK